MIETKDTLIVFFMTFGTILYRSIMSVSIIPVICYYNGQIVRTKADVEYEGSKTFNAPLNILVECMFQQLIDMIYSKTTIDKRRFNLVLICKYSLISGNRFQHFPIRDDSSVREMLNLVMSHPDSRSDQIGGSEPVSGCDNIYWHSLSDFIFQS